jgi:UDP-2-acetamido-2,6-beta-L-arabino-hexul-4-ose reductase
MSSRVKIEPVSFFTDARGWVVEPLSEEQIPHQRNVHVVFTEPGHVRGNHYHQHTTEVMLVMGPALVRLREASERRDVPVAAGEALRFTIPPGIAHAIQNTGTRPSVLTSFNDLPHDRNKPDTVREVLIES